MRALFLFAALLFGLADAPFDTAPAGRPWTLSCDFTAPVAINVAATTFTAGPRCPTVTFTRASSGWYFDATGTLQEAVTNTPRFDHSPTSPFAPLGLLKEQSTTNSIRNPRFEGAAAGSPGTQPTDMGDGTLPTSITNTVVGAATEQGMPCFDQTFAGTSGGAGTIRFDFETTTGITATNNNLWTLSVYQRITAGSTANLTSPVLGIDENTSGGANVVSTTGAVALPTSAAAAGQRVLYQHQLAGGGTVARVQPFIRYSVANGVAVNITLRVCAPQMERFSTNAPVQTFPLATSIILPPAGTPGASARAVDDAHIASSGYWFSPAQGGTLAVSFLSAGPFAAGGSNIAARISDGTSNNFLGVQLAGTSSPGYITGNIKANSGTAVTFTPTVAFVPNAQQRMVLSAAPSQVVYAARGIPGIASTAGVGLLPIGINQLDIGQTPGATNQCTCWIQRIRYSPYRMSPSRVSSLAAQ